MNLDQRQQAYNLGEDMKLAVQNMESEIPNQLAKRPGLAMDTGDVPTTCKRPNTINLDESRVTDHGHEQTREAADRLNM